ncbi:MAG: DinB/UmuC family translesion DNA polymerase, partial [Nitrososphaerota archaeon]
TSDSVEKFLDPLKIREIPGIGKKTEEQFGEEKFETIFQLKKLDVFTLNKMFGRKIGTYIYNAARGIDDEPVTQRQLTIQYSKIVTLTQDSKDYDFLVASLLELCNGLHSTIIEENRMFKSVGIQFIQTDLSSKTKSKMLKNPTSSLEELQKTAMQLLQEALENQTMLVRRLGVKVSELSEVQGQSNITSYF